MFNQNDYLTYDNNYYLDKVSGAFEDGAVTMMDELKKRKKH